MVTRWLLSLIHLKCCLALLNFTLQLLNRLVHLCNPLLIKSLGLAELFLHAVELLFELGIRFFNGNSFSLHFELQLVQFVGWRFDFALQSEFVQLCLELLILNFLISHNLFQQADIVLQLKYLSLLLISALLCLDLAVHFLMRLYRGLLAGGLIANRSNIVLDGRIAGLMVGERVMVCLKR